MKKISQKVVIEKIKQQELSTVKGGKKSDIDLEEVPVTPTTR